MCNHSAATVCANQSTYHMKLNPISILDTQLGMHEFNKSSLTPGYALSFQFLKCFGPVHIRKVNRYTLNSMSFEVTIAKLSQLHDRAAIAAMKH